FPVPFASAPASAEAHWGSFPGAFAADRAAAIARIRRCLPDPFLLGTFAGWSVWDRRIGEVIVSRLHRSFARLLWGKKLLRRLTLQGPFQV
nr:hypothetical protein [Tanacetum cinerariifolium]